MPALQIRVTEDQYKRLSLNAIASGVSQSDLVRGFIEQMPDLHVVPVTANASSNPATPAQAVATTTDATVLPQAQGEPSTIGFSSSQGVDALLAQRKATSIDELNRYMQSPNASNESLPAVSELQPAAKRAAGNMFLDKAAEYRSL